MWLYKNIGNDAAEDFTSFPFHLSPSHDQSCPGILAGGCICGSLQHAEPRRRPGSPWSPGARWQQGWTCTLHEGRMLFWCLFIDAETIFRDRGFLFYSSPSPRTCLQVFLLLQQLLQGLGGTGSGCESPSSVAIALQSSLTWWVLNRL